MRVRSYVVVRRDRDQTTRLCWLSSADSEPYCGICMRATVEPVVDERCPACQSRVERVFEVLDGRRR